MTMVPPEGQEYYVGDRVYYQGPPPPKEENVRVSVEQKERKWGCCMWILTAFFIIVSVLLVVILILFFTLGDRNKTYRRRITSAGRIDTTISHTESVSPELVLTGIETGSPKLCIFDTVYLGENQDAIFAAEHIPNSRRFDIERVVTQTAAKRRNLVSPLEFQTYVRSLGVDNDCHVVLYDHGESQQSLMTATYVWWLFKVFGHERVSVMHGGLRGWKDREYSVTSATPRAVALGDFQASWNPDRLVTFEDVMRNSQESGKYILLDARDSLQFDGQERYPLAKQAGRIRGATNVQANTLITQNGALKSSDQLRQIFSNQGVNGLKPVIVYDNTGLLASVLYYALVQENVPAKLYDGGWVEWSFRAPDNLKILF